MKVKMITKTFEKFPEERWGNLEGNHGTSYGSTYDVYGVFFATGAQFLILRDYDMFTWLPSEMFSVVDGAIPDDWIISESPTKPLIMGPGAIIYSDETVAGALDDCHIKKKLRERMATKKNTLADAIIKRAFSDENYEPTQDERNRVLGLPEDASEQAIIDCVMESVINQKQ